jgi:hypothetical protein
MQIHVSLPSALDGDEWSASCPSRFIPGERAPGTHWLGGWMGPRTGLDTEENYLLPLPGTKPRFFSRPVLSPSLYRLTYPGSCIQQVSCSNLEWGCSLPWS